MVGVTFFATITADLSRGSVVQPKRKNWKAGKTFASLQFVEDALRYIEGHPEEKEEHVLLWGAIERIKKGELALWAWLKPEDYLAQEKKKQ